MMSKAELRLTLARLELRPADAAQLLGVTARTIRRWLEGEDVAGPAEQALRAWIRLHDRNLPWRPDEESVVRDDQDQIARHRAHAIRLDEILARVEARGGPRLPWSVDRGRQIATLGPMELSYYKLASGSFSLANYRRKDGELDIERDWEAIEDAAACIAEAMKKDPNYGPVVLVTHDGPALGRVAKQYQREFETNLAALRVVCASLGSSGLHDPFIIGKNSADLIWHTQDLRRECERRRAAPAALADVAKYTRRNSEFFVRNGPRLPTPAETTKRRRRIEALADQIDVLAEGAHDGLVEYQQFESVLGRLRGSRSRC
jgi:hypothetical protein